MGIGLYGCDQGNETRTAARHAGDTIRTEAMEINASTKVGVGLELEHMRTLFQLGCLDTLEKYAKDLTAEWGSDFLAPPMERGMSSKKYEKIYDKAASQHYHRVVAKVQGMLSTAMRGESALLRSDGIALGRDGANLHSPNSEGLVNVGNAKDDWNHPSGEY